MVIDVGAHVGLHTLFFSYGVGATGRVVAVEPSPANAKLLRAHLRWNDRRNVEVVETLVADYEGRTEFAFRTKSTDPGGFANSLAYNIGGATAIVPVTTIDVICENFAPDLVKIDVEGAEFDVLQGAAQLVARAQPAILLATHDTKIHLRCCDLLQSWGYQLSAVNDTESVTQTDEILARPHRIELCRATPNTGRH
jgi:FkbM family methyltransferase